MDQTQISYAVWDDWPDMVRDVPLSLPRTLLSRTKFHRTRPQVVAGQKFLRNWHLGMNQFFGRNLQNKTKIAEHRLLSVNPSI